MSIVKCGLHIFLAALLLGFYNLGYAVSKEMIEAQSYIMDVKLRPGEPIDALPPYKELELYHYSPTGLRDPFGLPSFTTAATKGRPDINRPKGQLEAFTLDSLRMVGTLAKKTQKWALISAPNGVIYRVTKGAYLGKDYGKIISIDKDKIEIIETVPDGIGGWKKREAVLAFSE